MGTYPERLTENLFEKGNYNISLRERSIPYELHWHDFYEIDVVISGAYYTNLNGRELRINEGDINMVSSVDFHDMRPCGNGKVVYYNIMFSEQQLSDMFSALINRFELPVVITPEKVRFRRITELCRLMHENSVNTLSAYYSNNLLECIMMELMNCTGIDTVQCESFYTIRNALNYIHENFRGKITLNDIAEQCGYSPSYMSRVFREFTGQTFGNYLSRLRCRYAKTMIASTAIPIYDICFESGFNSLSQFSRTFRKHCGFSPGMLRKKSK